VTTSTERYVFDSFALLALFQGEPAAGQVRALLARLRGEEIMIAMATVNLGEVVYRTVRRFDRERAREVLASISQLPIQLIDVDRALALAGAAIKGEHPISYADCIAAALAQRLDAAVVTGDADFRRLEHLVRVEWLPTS